MPSGLDRIEPHLRDLLRRGGRLRLLTGDYLGITEPDALMRLLDFEGERQIRVFETAHPPGPAHPGPPAPLSFHPKAYVLERRDGTGVAFVGSSNLSQSALLTGIEWNYRAVAKADAAAFEEIRTAFDSLFHHPATRQLTDDWIDAYRKRRQKREWKKAQDPAEVPEEPKRYYEEFVELHGARDSSAEKTSTFSNCRSLR
jgi:HKD family nuclease